MAEVVAAPPLMLAIASTGASGRSEVEVNKLLESGDWVADTKLDGIRAVISERRIFNRTGVDITHKYPEIPEVVLKASELVILDGEIVAEDGTFESALTRDSQENRSKILGMVITYPVRFVAFDLPAFSGPWMHRRNCLETMSLGGIDITPVGSDAAFVQAVRDAGMEGVILKRRSSRYQPKRSADWIKHKFTERITCIAYGYEPGNGSRSHFGAMLIALIRDGEAVPIGRVGSGFTERQTHELKARLDAGAFFPVEVEALNRTSGFQLRFPVFRGVRTDKTVEECTWDQLMSLRPC